MRWKYYHTRSPRRTCFRLTDARLCMNCEVIFEADTCPVCGSEAFVPISKWVQPLQPAAPPSEVRAEEAGSRRVREVGAHGPVSLVFRYFSVRPGKTGLGKS